MNTSQFPDNRSTTLDTTQETKDLRLQVIEKENQYQAVIAELDQLKLEVSEFQKLYESKIGRLYTRIQELENLLWKYEHISEYVDDIFTFSEAEKVFEETMREQRQRQDEEFRKRNRVKKSTHAREGIGESNKSELKRLYRHLAHAFHPDKAGGDARLMKQINTAYKDGNLQELRALAISHKTTQKDDTLTGLHHRLRIMTSLISTARKEKISLEHSDLVVMKENIRKTGTIHPETALDAIAHELMEEIYRKEKQVDQFTKKFGITSVDA